jgi:hypothetical protein
VENKLRLFIVLGLGLLLFGCTAQPAAPTATPGAEVVKYVCADGKVVERAELCPAAAAAAARELTTAEQLSVCTGMPEASVGPMEELCIMGVAAKNKDAPLCQEASRDVRASCYALVATEKSDVNVCLTAGTYKDKCFDEYARNNKDASACDKISDINYKDSCYSNLVNTLGTPALCDKIVSVGSKDGCYWNIAMRLRDTAYCNKITSADQKQSCLQNIGGGQSQKPA